MSAAPRGVIALMSSVDSHLQGMQHYAYGREQREAMGIAQEMLDELIEIAEWARVERAPLRPQEIDSILRLIAKATGSAT